MSDEQPPSVEALLEEARLKAFMPGPAERLRLRKAADLSRAQVANACGVGRQTVANWEDGTSDPRPPARLPYLRLLEGLAQLHPAPATPLPAAPVQDAVGAAFGVPETARGADGLAIQGEPGPCLRCGRMTPYKATNGESLHVGGMCEPAQPAGHPSSTAAAPSGPAPTEPASRAADPPAAPVRHPRPARRARAAADISTLITNAVNEELEKADGDLDAAITVLIKRAIPDVMLLLDETRHTGRYNYTAYPDQPSILVKPNKRDPDQIWEARASWHHPDYSHRIPGSLAVSALDVNAAYLTAMKTWLPIGKLEHSTAGVHDRKRSGVYLVTPPAWEHPELPNPLGARDEPGPLWITDPTLRLMLRLAGPKYALCEAPVIHESWTSGATENFLDDLRTVLTQARQAALDAGDDVTLQYVKSMYSKFVSTLGESIDNRKIDRADWMHIVRSQSFALLWLKAYKAHQAGLTVIAVKGTDELHVTGDWRSVFAEGNSIDQMKIKYGSGKALGEYTVGEVAR